MSYLFRAFRLYALAAKAAKATKASKIPQARKFSTHTQKDFDVLVKSNKLLEKKLQVTTIYGGLTSFIIMCGIMEQSRKQSRNIKEPIRGQTRLPPHDIS